MAEVRGTPGEMRLREQLRERDEKIADLVGKLRAQEERAERLKVQRDEAVGRAEEERRRNADLSSHLAGERRRLEMLAADYERLHEELAAGASTEHLGKRAP